MINGPKPLFEDPHFIYIFQTCVHLIGSVNALEEQHKILKKPFDSKILLSTRQLCQNCLDLFDQLTPIYHALQQSQVNYWINKFEDLRQQLQALLLLPLDMFDHDIKNEMLPLMYQHLVLFQRGLVQDTDTSSTQTNEMTPPSIKSGCDVADCVDVKEWISNPFMDSFDYASVSLKSINTITYGFDRLRHIIARIPALEFVKPGPSSEATELQDFSTIESKP